MDRQFRVVGGEYQSLQFDEVVGGTSRALGPYPDVERARQLRCECLEARRSQASTRYTIVTNAGAVAESVG